MCVCVSVYVMRVWQVSGVINSAAQCTFVTVSCAPIGGNFACAVTKTGHVVCWGSDIYKKCTCVCVCM